MTYWMHFAIQTAIGLAEAFVSGNSTLTDDQKVNLIGFIDAGNKLLNSFVK